MKMKRLLSTILAIAMVLVLCPSTQIIFAEEELTATQIKGTVKATADAGAPLGTAVFAYDFANDSENWPIVTAEGDPVNGTFKWNAPTTWLRESGTYAFTFVPANSNTYASCSGEAVVLLNFDKDTAIENPVLDQDFDNGAFSAGSAGTIDDSVNGGGKWDNFAVDATTSHIVTGTNPVADNDKVYIDNQVMKLVRFDSGRGHVKGAFGSNFSLDTDYIVSFRLKFTGGGPMQVTMANGLTSQSEVQSGLKITAAGVVTIGANSDVTVGTLPLNTWATVTVVSNQTDKKYTVTVTPDGQESLIATTDINETVKHSNFSKLSFICDVCANGTVLAYIDDVRVDKIVDNDRIPVLSQKFNDTTLFPADQLISANIAAGGVGGTWEFGTDKSTSPTASSGIADVTEGDGYVTYASSGYQSLKAVRTSSGKGALVIYPDAPIANDNDIILSYRFFRPANAGGFTMAVGRSDQNSRAYYKVDADGSLSLYNSGWVDTKVDLPTNVWMTVTVTADYANTSYKMKIVPDGQAEIVVNGISGVAAEGFTHMYIAGITNDTVLGYFDDFLLEEVVDDGDNVVHIDQDFEDTSLFVVGSNSDVGTSGDIGGRWNPTEDDTLTTLVINTQDGDGAAIDHVYSKDFAVQGVRKTVNDKQNITANLTDESGNRKYVYNTQDYRFSAMIRVASSGVFDIATGAGGEGTTSAQVRITANNQIQVRKDGVLTNTEKYVLSNIWYQLTITTDRANGTYAVKLVPVGEGMEDYIVETSGDLLDYEFFYLRFIATYDGGKFYYDDVELVTLTPSIAETTANVTLPEGFTGDITTPKGGDYTFYAPENSYYNYELSATIGGFAVDVEDKGNGSYTVGPVGGDVNVTIKTQTGKSFAVTLADTEAASDVDGFVNSAKYGVNYALTLNPVDGYNYTVTATIGGGESFELTPAGENVYTIDGTAITGAIEITVTRELKTYDVTFTGTGEGNVVDKTKKATHGQDYTFTVNAAEGVDYTVIFNEAVLTPVDGVYTIPGAQVTDTLIIQVGKVALVCPDGLVVTVKAGKALKDAEIEGRFVDAETRSNEITGTFTWTNPALWMNENRVVEYTFAPDDLENYKPYTGTVMVTMVGDMKPTAVMGQNFDETGKFVFGVAAGEAVDGWTYGESAVVSGTNPPADKHRVFYNNRVLAATRYLSNYGTVITEFNDGNIGQTNDFTLTFRVFRVEEHAFIVGLGNGQYGGDKQHVSVCFAADGSITLVDGTAVVGETTTVLEKNVWATVELTTNKSGSATGNYTVTVTPDGGESMTGTTAAKDNNTTTGYGSSNVNKLTVYAPNVPSTYHLYAYLDDFHLVRTTNSGAEDNTVWLSQNFDDTADFTTDYVYTEYASSSSPLTLGAPGGKWQFIAGTQDEVKQGSYVTDIAEGDHYISYAYSGHQSLYLNRGKGGNRQFSVGHVYGGSNFPYFAKETLYKEDDFEYSFRFYWIGGAFEVYFARLAGQAQSQAYLSVNASGAISVFGSESNTSTLTASTKTLPLNEWCKITVASNRANNRYTVSVNGEEFIRGYVKPDGASSATVGGLIFKAGYEARAGYLDDVSFDKIVLENGEIVSRTPLIFQNFENTNAFDTSYNYTAIGSEKLIDIGGTDGYWKMQFTSTDLEEPVFINTHDGDGLVDMVYSGTQSLKLSGGKPFRYALTEAFAAAQNYSFSARVYLLRGQEMTISFTDGENADATISLNYTALMPNTWATVVLTTDRNTGKYTVTVTPDNGAEYKTTGDLAGEAINQIVFASESEGNVAYVDNVSLNRLDLIIADKPVYQVTLPSVMVANNEAVLGEGFVFAIGNSNYTYTNITATMDGNAVDVTDNGDGTYTIANVCGDIEVAATVTPKIYTVTVNGSAESSVSASGTATYATDYVFTIEKETGYTYEVVVRWNGGRVAFTEGPDGTYTIPGAGIRGDLTITVNKTFKKYAIEWQGNALVDLAGKLVEVEYGQEYSFIVNKVAGYTYSVSAKIGETPVSVIEVGNRYSIAQGVITGPITIAVNKVLASYAVDWETIPGGVTITEKLDEVTHGEAYEFTLTGNENCVYTVTVNGNKLTPVDGTYTIAADVVVGNLTIQITEQQKITVEDTLFAKVEAGKALGTAKITINGGEAQQPENGAYRVTLGGQAGTLTWVRPSTWMNESRECDYIFTPDDETLAPVEGTVTVSIYSETMDEEVILEQNFDDEGIFQVGVAGTGDNLVIDATGSNANGGEWRGFGDGSNVNSHIVSGKHTTEDKHNVFYNNRVLALKYETLSNNCPVLVSFPDSSIGQTNDFIVRLRIQRVDDAAMWVGLGNGQYDPDKQHAAVVIGADGAVTIGDATESIGTLEKGVWATVEMVSNKDGQAAAPYTVTVTPDNGTPITGTGTTKNGTPFAEGGYNSSNVTKLIIRATSGTADTVIAYMDDVYVERVTNNPVQVNESFDDTSIFTTDAVPTTNITGSTGEIWEFKTTTVNSVTAGSCVVDIVDGDHYRPLAYSGHQALYFGTDSAKDVHGTLTAGYFNTAAFNVTEDDFEISFRMYWMGETAVNMPLGRSRAFALGLAYMKIGADGTFYVSGDGSTTVDKAATNGKMPAKVWTTLNIVSNRSAGGTFTVTGRGDDGSTFSVEGKLSTLSNNLGGMWFYGLTKGAAGGYLDDFKFVKISSSVRTVMIDQNFEDVTMFDASASYDRANYASDSITFATNSSNSVDTWKVETRTDAEKPAVPVINTHDGDVAGEPVYSNNQAVLVGRSTKPLQAFLRRDMDYGNDNYRLTFKIRFLQGDIQINMGNTVLTYCDAAINIDENYNVGVHENGAFSYENGNVVIPHIWYEVTLTKDCTTGKYTVKFDPTCGTGEEFTVNAQTANLVNPATNQKYVRFQADLNKQSAYVDDVKLVLLTPVVADPEKFDVTLGEGFTGENVVTLDEDYTYTFSIDEWDEHYNYTFNATMGGNPVEVIDNGDGTYTIEDVYGDIVINGLNVTAKTYNIIFTGDGALDAVGSATAGYDTEYTFTLTKDENYDYVVTVGGEEQTPDEEGTYTITVTGDMEIAVAKTEKTVNVEVVWGTMTFEYEHTSWDAKTHSWNGAWKPDGTNYITVTNHGGVAITVRYYFAVELGKPVNRVTGWNFTSDAAGETVISEAVPLEVGADPYTAYLNLTGAPTTAFEDEVLGTATVEIQ